MADEQSAPVRGISAWARTEPDRPAMLLDDEVRTFGELEARAGALAGALSERSVGADGRVAIMLPNGFEFFETWAAATKPETTLRAISLIGRTRSRSRRTATSTCPTGT